MSGKTVIIEENEYKDLLVAKDKGLFFIDSLNTAINLSSIETIVPGDVARLSYPLGEPCDISKWLKEKAAEGKLGDGEVVKRLES